MNSQPFGRDTKITIITTRPQEPTKMYYLYSPYPPPVPTFYSNCHIWHLAHALATPEPLDNMSHLCHVTSRHSFLPTPTIHHYHTPTLTTSCHPPHAAEHHSKTRGMVRKLEAREVSRRDREQRQEALACMQQPPRLPCHHCAGMEARGTGT